MTEAWNAWCDRFLSEKDVKFGVQAAIFSLAGEQWGARPTTFRLPQPAVKNIIARIQEGAGDGVTVGGDKFMFIKNEDDAGVKYATFKHKSLGLTCCAGNQCVVVCMYGDGQDGRSNCNHVLKTMKQLYTLGF